MAKKKSESESKPSATAEKLAEAKARANSLRSEVAHARQSLEAAYSISTISHREAAVADRRARYETLRAKLEEADGNLDALRAKLGVDGHYRTATLGKKAGSKPASAAARRGEPKR